VLARGLSEYDAAECAALMGRPSPEREASVAMPRAAGACIHRDQLVMLVKRDELVAVTGATGFVGQAVLLAAARQNLDVRALTRRKQRAARRGRRG